MAKINIYKHSIDLKRLRIKKAIIAGSHQQPGLFFEEKPF